MPFRYTARLEGGVGACNTWNVVHVPSIFPEGISPSMKLKFTPPPEPHAPAVPSTRTQSPGLPAAAPRFPRESMTAVRELMYEVPFKGRTVSSLVNPVTSAMLISVTTGPGPITVPTPMRTSLTLSVVGLGGTAHVSPYWNLPWLLYRTE